MLRFTSLISFGCLIFPWLPGCQVSDPLMTTTQPEVPPRERELRREAPPPTTVSSRVVSTFPVSAPSPVDAALANKLVAELNAGTLALLPRSGGKPVVRSNSIFSSYRSATPRGGVWDKKNWTWKIDLTGVSWDRPQSVTLVSPRHALMANHYKRKAKFPVIFHDRTGKKVQRKLIKSIHIKGTDIAVTLLDRAVPPGVKHYRVLAPSEKYATTLPGAYALITNRLRMVHLHQIRMVNNRFGSIMYQKAADLPEGYYKPLVKGDSGNPAFLWLRGEPVLIETHSGGGPGSGPFFCTPKNFAAINAAMRNVSEAKSAPVYQLKTAQP